MTDKKMTKDEAERAANDWMDKADTVMYVKEHEDSFCVFLSNTAHSLARFPFEPPHPEKGTTCKFWNGDEKAFVIAPLAGIDLDDEPRYRVTNVGWFNHAEPYTLIDPDEHAKAKQAEAVLAELLPLCKKIVDKYRNNKSHHKTVMDMAELLE